MRTLIGGAIATVLGLIFTAVWFDSILNIIAGILPPVMILGGCFALYIGYDELKESWDNETVLSNFSEKEAKEKIVELEKEIKNLKTKKIKKSSETVKKKRAKKAAKK